MMQPVDAAVFDCDGVILDSNHLKSAAFGEALEGYPGDAVEAFVAWHQRTGGVSRYEKFRVFFADYVEVDDPGAAVEQALAAFAGIVSAGLRSCSEIPGSVSLACSMRDAGLPVTVNTGGDQAEVRAAFRDRGIDGVFKDILGSPSTKRQNMHTIADSGDLGRAGVYFGDAALDLDLAEEFGMRFVFVSGRSDWADGTRICRDKGHVVLPDLSGLRLGGNNELLLSSVPEESMRS